MKEFCTYEKQVQILRDRGLVITDEGAAIQSLKQEGYYNLINGYSEIFQTHKKYIAGTKFEDIVSLYKFDQNLRSIFYKYTSIIECRIKAIIGHEFSRSQGVDEKKYLTKVSFTPNPKKEKDVKTLIEKCNETIKNGSDQKSNKFRNYIYHYVTKHGHIPFWVLVHGLSFGTTSKFYSLMLTDQKNTIAGEFGLNNEQLTNLLGIIVCFRNIVAHGERIFLAQLKISLTSNLSIFKKLSLPKYSDGNEKCGKKDVLALLVCCKYMLSDDEFENLINELQVAVETLKAQVNDDIMRKVMIAMGMKSVSLRVILSVSK